jgi:serine/threonine protein kinase/WD40 repeat protein
MKLENMQFGTYKLISLIGKGGMAQVWLANQTTLNREVAVKVIPENADMNDEGHLTERFAREARSVARLDHPNILPVIDYGSAEGYLYLVMPYVRGGSLQERLKKETLVRAQAFEIFEQILNGLAFAHRQGILHRDLKPANILLHLDGRAMIADFGVAKALNDDMGLTQTGLTVGSPEYMAPEQFMGRSEFRSDLYSMGVILYRLLTGRSLYTGTTTWEIGMRHMNDPLPLPNPQVPLALETFLAKALHKRPEERYASAEEMGAALHRAISQLSPAELQARPVRANVTTQTVPLPTPGVQRPAEPTRVLPTPSELKIVPPGSTTGYPGRETTQTPPSRPEMPSSAMAQSQPGIGPGPASSAGWMAGPPSSGMVMQPPPPVQPGTPGPIPVIPPQKPKSKVPIWLIIGLGVLVVAAVVVGLILALSSGSGGSTATTTANLPTVTSTTGTNTTAAVTTAQITSAQATTAAGTTVANTAASTTATATPAKVTALSTVALTGHSGPVNMVSWSKDGKFYVTASDDKTLKIWDAATNKTTLTLDDKNRPNKDRVVAAVWSDSGQQIIAAAADKYIRYYDAKSGTVLVEASDGVAPKAAAISPDDSLIPYPGPGVLHTWDLKNDDNGPDIALGANTVEVNALAFTSDSKFLAVGLSDDRVLIFDIAAKKIAFTIPGKDGPDPVTALAWTPDNKQLAVGRQKTFNTYQLNLAGASVAGQPVNSPVKAPVTTLSISADGKRLAVGSQNGDVEFWSLEDNKRIQSFNSGANSVVGLHWSQDNAQVAVATGGSQPALSTFSATPAAAATGASLKVTLKPQNGTKVSGVAVIADNGNGTVTVSLAMTGLTPGAHHAHIHQGTCVQQGDIVYNLPDILAGADGTGSATTTLQVSFALVTSGRYYFAVHNDPGTPTYYASCGEITT